MNSERLMKKIYKQIKKYDTIVIGRHVGPDPDCLGSQLALRDIILNTFPEKKVYAIGSPANRFRFMGTLDKIHDDMYDNSLLIVLDLPNKARLDGIDADKFAYSIKIDHHPFIETFCDIEWIDDTASSTAQLILEMVYNTKLVLTKEAGEKLFIGIVADTNRFLFYYTTGKTFKLVSRLVDETHIDITSLYDNLYLTPMKEVKFQGYIAENFTITEHGFAYILLTEEVMNKFKVDPATAGKMVNNFNYIEGIYSWAVFSHDKMNGNIRGALRSRGPIINKTAEKYGGGGHIYASGVRLKTDEEVMLLVDDLDKVCAEYTKES